MSTSLKTNLLKVKNFSNKRLFYRKELFIIKVLFFFFFIRLENLSFTPIPLKSQKNGFRLKENRDLYGCPPVPGSKDRLM